MPVQCLSRPATVGKRPEGQTPSGGERGELAGGWEGHWPELLMGMAKLSSSTTLTKMLVNDDDDDDNDEGCSGCFLSTIYVPGTKRGSSHICTLQPASVSQ